MLYSPPRGCRCDATGELKVSGEFKGVRCPVHFIVDFLV